MENTSIIAAIVAGRTEFQCRDGAGQVWDIVSLASTSKWDCWATKAGTEGKTRATRKRFWAKNTRAMSATAPADWVVI